MTYDREFIDSLKTLMHAVLDGVVSVFEQSGIELPDRRYTLFGAPAHDKEQVTVSFQQLYAGPPGDQGTAPQRCDAPRTAVLLVEVTRCLPQPGTRGGVTQEQLQETSDRQAVDAWMLLEAGLNAVDRFGAGVMADVTAGEAGGAMQSISMNLILQVP